MTSSSSLSTTRDATTSSSAIGVNSNNEVYTAVCLNDDDDTTTLNEPLLSNDFETIASSPNPASASTAWNMRDLYWSFRFHGLVIGFLAQLVNVTGTTYMYYKWETPHSNNGGADDESLSASSWMDLTLHWIIWIITQADLYLYLAMWISLTAVLTRPGMNFVLETYFSKTSTMSSSASVEQPTKRSIFVLGVQFYIGVVMGVFLAWTGIDCMLGLPVPVLPMIGVLMFGLLISYTMVWCYDLEEEEDYEEDYIKQEKENVVYFV